MSDFFIDDAIGFTRKGRPFHPIISDSKENQYFKHTNVHTIALDCSMTSDLKWEEEERKVKKSIEEEKYLFWDLDFGWNRPWIQTPYPMALPSFLVAVNTFLKKFYLPYQKETFGVNLYRGNKIFPWQWNQMYQEGFNQWIEEYPSLPEPKIFYKISLLSEFLHTLAANLPHDVLSFAFFDRIALPRALLVHLLSKEFFPYLLVITREKTLPIGPLFWKNGLFHMRCFPKKGEAKIGLVLPLNQNIHAQNVEKVKMFIEIFQQQKRNFRLISEAYLNESWDALDDLILLSDSLSSQGKRKVKGFVAAGGRLIVHGAPLNMRREISWEEYQRKRA